MSWILSAATLTAGCPDLLGHFQGRELITSLGSLSCHQKAGWAGRLKKWVHVGSWTCRWVFSTLSLALIMSFEATWKVSVLLCEISLIFVGVECPFPYILTILIFSRRNVYNTSPFRMWHDFCVLCYPGQAGIVVSMRDSEKAEDSFPFTNCWLMPFTVLSSVETQEMVEKSCCP